MTCASSPVIIAARRSGHSMPRSKAWRGYARISRARSTACWEITTPFAWSPELDEMGIRMLLNECETISRGDEAIYLAGIDDAHYYRVDNIEKAASEIPDNGFSILLSHTPEIYRQAAHAGFDLLLSGHTHGGQICLPGSIPITLDSVLPRHMGSGPWKYRDMVGYTSVGVGSSIVAVRINCLPEITLHHLQCA